MPVCHAKTSLHNDGYPSPTGLLNNDPPGTWKSRNIIANVDMSNKKRNIATWNAREASDS